MLRVWLVGQLAVEWDGEPEPLPSAERARALVGFLALHPGPQRRARVAAALWADMPEDAARASLRTALWSLRRAWGSHADTLLTVTRSDIGLAPQRLWVDAVDDDPGRGQLLPEVDDDWLVAEREVLHRRRLAKLDDDITAAEADGRLTEASRQARRRCELAPLDERAHRRLITLLTADGDRAGAAEAAGRFARLLRDELGVVPSAATRAAHAAARTGSLLPVRPQLFGRAAEVAALQEQWRMAANGSGRVVVLTGEAGIGKSSLVAELGHRVGGSGGRRAIGAGIDVGGETPFATWLELAGKLVRTVAIPGPAAGWPAELNRLSSTLGARLGRDGPPSAVAAPELERLRVFDSVLSLVEWSCSDRPLLIAVDDAHRTDAVSLRLTAHVGRRIAALPILMVLTRRDRPSNSAVDGLLADLIATRVPVTELDLAPIADVAVAAIVRRIAGPLIDAGLLNRVITAAEGNPLLAEETARSIAAGGVTAPNLRTAVRATVRGLPSPARDLLRLLAVAGRPLQPRETTALGIDGVEQAVDAAVESGLAVDGPDGLGFRHAMLREAVYADLDNTRTLHNRFVSALHGGDPAELAHHLALSGRSGEAAASWAAAAAHARSVGALAEAADFLQRATVLDPDNGHWWQELAEIHAWSGQRGDMATAFARALELLPRDELADAWCRQGRQLRTVVCNPNASIRAYRQAAQWLSRGSSTETQAAVLIGLAWGEAVDGDVGLVDDLLGRAQAFLPADPDDETLSDIGEIRLLRLIRQGRFDECGDAARDAATSATKALRPDRGFAIWLHGACAETCAGNLTAALDLADLAVESTKAIPVLLIGCLGARAHLLARLGRFGEAADCVAQQLTCAERTDEPRLVNTARHDAGLVALASGDYRTAAAMLQTALAGDFQASRPTASLACAEALALAGDVDAATAQLRSMTTEPVNRADQPWALVPRIARVQGLIAVAAGRTSLALKRFTEAEASWRRVLATVTQTNGEAYLANLVDLGRMPVLGLVEPERELSQLAEDIAGLAAGPTSIEAT